MRFRLILLLLLAVPLSSQTKTTGNADTKGSCSPAVTGNNNQFKITCEGIGKAQGEALLKILNQILASQMDADTVLKQIQENMGWVQLNQEQIGTLCNAIKPFKGQTVQIQVWNQTEDRLALANQLRDVLKSPLCGWDASVSTAMAFSGPDAPMLRGIFLQVQQETPAADAIGKALLDLFGPTAVRGSLDKNVKPDIIQISVWYKPR